MCGINGFNFENKKLIEQMNDSLKHRGPNAKGIFVNKKLSLGHRRLSVIDLSPSGNQPMKYSGKGKDVIIVFNGEIYNFKEIRKELQVKGYKFKTETDTEVILASYLEWGTNCVNKFNGMWAFCIYDPKEKLLFLSRDRLGQKPLYYFFDEERFIFSSEIKGILEHKVKLKLNKEAIDLYFSLGFIPAPYSIYEKVCKLEANTNLIFNLKSKKIKKTNYWKIPTYNPIFNKKQLIKEFNFLIKDATKLRMIADVPVGAFLSGGLDSSTVVREMKNLTNKQNLVTYSMGFKEGTDETPLIKKLIRHLGVKNNHSYFEEKFIDESLKNIYYYYDEPFVDASMFPSFHICKKAKEQLTVCLSGDGGDEIFGGYGPHKIAGQLTLIKKLPISLRKTIYNLIPSKGKLNKFKTGLYLSIINPEKIRSEARPKEQYTPKIFKKITQKELSKCLKLSKNNLVEAFIYYDRYFKTMGDNYLCKVDRASMAHALEVRSPFLDYRFVEFASKIPSKWKTDGFGTKILLKNAIRKNLPKEILRAKKVGFSPSINEWIRREGNMKKTKEALVYIKNNKIISDEWISFFERILKEQGSEEHKIRLLLFYKWLKVWRR